MSAKKKRNTWDDRREEMLDQLGQARCALVNGAIAAAWSNVHVVEEMLADESRRWHRNDQRNRNRSLKRKVNRVRFP